MTNEDLVRRTLDLAPDVTEIKITGERPDALSGSYTLINGVRRTFSVLRSEATPEFLAGQMQLSAESGSRE